MKTFSLVVVSRLFVLTSCVKEGKTNFQAFLKNETSHSFHADFYYSGSSTPSRQIILLPGVQFQIADNNQRGILNNGGFGFDYFSGADSLRITFDSVYSVTHYIYAPIPLARKHYLNTSIRNIFSKESYNLMEINSSKYKRKNVYTYSFKEADYQFARN